MLSKDEILETYLNIAPYGGNLRGVEAAARHYFSRSCADLSLAEAALLVGLPQSPERLRPDRHPLRARLRQRVVLRRMEKLGMISAAQRVRAEQQVLRYGSRKRTSCALHVVEQALR